MHRVFFSTLLSGLAIVASAAETVDIIPPLVEGRAIYAGPQYMPAGTRALIVDKVCEALGNGRMQSNETKFVVVSGAQEFAFVSQEPDERLTFYFLKVGRPENKETVAYLSRLTCFK